LSGLVDSDRFHDVGILFPAVWLDAGFSGVLPKGMPVAQCVPVPRVPLDLTYQSFAPDETKRYDETAQTLLSGPGHYRKTFRAARSGADSATAEEVAPQNGRVEP
jgi:hypothetical protein